MGSLCCKEISQTSYEQSQKKDNHKRCSIDKILQLEKEKPASKMILSQGHKSEASNSEMYFSCITRKDGVVPSEDKENMPPADNILLLQDMPAYSTPLFTNIQNDKPFKEVHQNNQELSDRKCQLKTFTFDENSTQSLRNKTESGSNSIMNEEDGFFEARSFFGSQLGKKVEIEDNDFSEGVQALNISQKIEFGVSDQNNLIDSRWIEETEAKLDKIQKNIDEGFESYQQVYESMEALHKLKVHIKRESNEENNEKLQVHASWYIPCKAEDYIGYTNSLQDLTEILKHFKIVGQFETIEKSEAGPYSVYYFNFQIEEENIGLALAKSFSKSKQNFWCDFFTSVDYPKDVELKPVKRINSLFGGHFVENISSGEKQKDLSRVSLYLEAILNRDFSETFINISFSEVLRFYVEKHISNLAKQ